jgi:hypothetical protein
MYKCISSIVVPLLSLTALIVFCGGCGGGGGGAAAPPSDEVARRSLESALQAWQSGEKPGVLAGTDPKVQVQDTPWAQGEKLASFEILQAEPNGAGKRFSVRLTLSKPAGVKEVQYYVLGLGPVMVFRDEDYARNINMEDGPIPAKSSKQSRRGRS